MMDNGTTASIMAQAPFHGLMDANMRYAQADGLCTAIMADVAYSNTSDQTTDPEQSSFGSDRLPPSSAWNNEHCAVCIGAVGAQQNAWPRHVHRCSGPSVVWAIFQWQWTRLDLYAMRPAQTQQTARLVQQLCQ